MLCSHSCCFCVLGSTVLSGHTDGLEGEEKALALVAQKSRKVRPVPIHDQITRAMRMNKKVRNGLLSEEDERLARVGSPK